MKLTQSLLKEILDYNPETGLFTWRVNKARRIKIGNIAGCLDKQSGYMKIGIDNNLYLAHRLAFLWIDGYLPENDIDHIDRNRSNNRYYNLREVSQTCNSRNCNIAKNNASGITGISWYKRTNKWKAQIAMPKVIGLGYFDTLSDAVKARWKAEIEHNFPNCNTTSSAYLYLKENGLI